MQAGVDDPIALMIAAEVASSLGRPSEARRLAQRAMATAGGSIDAIFAGMPRAGVWPPDADEPPPTAPTLFDRGAGDRGAGRGRRLRGGIPGVVRGGRHRPFRRVR